MFKWRPSTRDPFPVAPRPFTLPFVPADARNPFHALRHRNFRLFFAGQFISLVGSWMQVVTQGWLVLELSNSPFQVGLVTSLEALPILLLTLYGGVLADRVDKRNALMFLQTGMLLESLALTVLTATGHITVGWVMILAPILGTCTAFEVPIRQAFMMEMVGREDLGNAIALNSSIFNVTRIVGPVIAGALLAAFGSTACFAVNTASFLAVIVAFLKMRPPFPGARTGPRDAAATFADGARYVIGRQEPRALLSLAAVLSIFGLGSCLAMLPVYAKDTLGLGAGGYGGLMAAVGVGAGFGAIAMAAFGHRVNLRKLIASASLGFAASIALSAMHAIVRLCPRHPGPGRVRRGPLRDLYQHAAADRGARCAARPGHRLLLVRGTGLCAVRLAAGGMDRRTLRRASYLSGGRADLCRGIVCLREGPSGG